METRYRSRARAHLWTVAACSKPNATRPLPTGILPMDGGGVGLAERLPSVYRT